VRKVLFALEYKQADFELVFTLPFKTPKAYLAKHPLAKVPCFEDEYVTLPDSSIICDYLDQKYPANSYYPKDFREKARAKWYEEYADTAVAEVLLTYYFQNFVKSVSGLGHPDAKAIKDVQRKKEPAMLGYLESIAPSSGFLFADGLMLCDIAIVGLFCCAELAEFSLCEQSYPRLSAYIERVKATKAMKKRLEEEAALIKAIQN
jgi:glutathione S-transferase